MTNAQMLSIIGPFLFLSIVLFVLLTYLFICYNRVVKRLIEAERQIAKIRNEAFGAWTVEEIEPHSHVTTSSGESLIYRGRYDNYGVSYDN